MSALQTTFGGRVRFVGKLLTSMIVLGVAPAHAGLIYVDQSASAKLCNDCGSAVRDPFGFDAEVRKDKGPLRSSTFDSWRVAQLSQYDRTYELPSRSIYQPAYTIHLNGQTAHFRAKDALVKPARYEMRQVRHDFGFDSPRLLERRIFFGSQLENLFRNLTARFQRDYPLWSGGRVPERPVNVPEPTTVALMLLGLAAMVVHRRRPFVTGVSDARTCRTAPCRA